MVEANELWAGAEIEVIGATGDYGSGKTLFGCTIDPENTLVIDAEKSSSVYEDSLGFDRIDLIMEARADHGDNYTPLQLFETFMRVINDAADVYSVWVIDPIVDIESGLVMYVTEHPEQFGYTDNQFKRMSGLKWGPVKEMYKRIVAVAAEKCQTLVFTSHLKPVWKGDKPTREKTPQGKSTLMELATLYLWLERPIDDKGRQQVEPSAKVLKSRLASASKVDGKLVMIPTLPPRLPVATPDAIRAYISNPPDPKKLKVGERAQDEPGLTDDERLELTAQIAEDRRAAAEVGSSDEPSFFAPKADVGDEPPKADADDTAMTAQLSPASLEQAAGQPGNGEDLGAGGVEAEVQGDRCTPEQLRDLLDLQTSLGIGKDVWAEIIEKRGVALCVDMDYRQADELIGKLKEAKLEEQQS